jgi:hypothetical protein
MRFLGESVLPLIQHIRQLALSSGITIPILGISTCSPARLVQQIQTKIAAYLLKPIDSDDLVYEVWNLIRLPRIIYLPSIQDYEMEQKTDKILPCVTEVI